MYALHGLDLHGLKVGDTTIVVGAGGGTVNLISYTITSLKLARTRQKMIPKRSISIMFGTISMLVTYYLTF